ncbi:MAG: DUF3298 and DUF4163 domain-containing protein [Firmicutes bacterium]|nr:DUF3298 and DUF4163 domain-containing protein [Bacillota bacterium]
MNHQRAKRWTDMHHSLIKFICAVSAAALIGGCAANCGAKISIETSQYETDTATLYVETPVFSSMEDTDFEDELNAEYETEIREKITEFESSESGEPLSGGNKRVLEIRQEVTYNTESFISVVTETYGYEGGAHGQSVKSAKNIDVSNGAVLELEDLFSDSDYKTVLNRLITEIMEENPNEYSNLWEKPVIKDSSARDFCLSADGLVIFYQPYDLSYYARGFVNFTIEYEDISGYLKDEYRAALTGA